MTAEVPKISVVTSCFRRPEFVEQCVRSVLAQDLPADQVEVLVLADGLEPAVVERLERLGARVLSGSYPRVGQMLCRGLRESRAEIVKFLDDDDVLLDPGALSEVLRTFSDPAPVVFYRSGLTAIDRTGRDVDQEWRRTHPRPERPLRITIRSSPRLAGRLLRERAYVNLSTFAVRREILLPHLDLLDGIEGATDLVMGSLSLASLERGDHLISPRPSVGYRVHPSSSHAVVSTGFGYNFGETHRALSSMTQIRPAVQGPRLAERFWRFTYLETEMSGFASGAMPRPSVGDWLSFGLSAGSRRQLYVAWDFVRLAPKMLLGRSAG